MCVSPGVSTCNVLTVTIVMMLMLYYASSSFADQVRLRSVLNSFAFTASCDFINFKAVSVSSFPYCGIMAQRFFEMEAEADSGSSDIE